jgi:drug/metabolite transporter (DMT)-like permease
MFSMKGIFIKLAYGPGGHAVDAITLLALRMGFAFPVYAAIAVWVWRRQVMFGRPRPTGKQMLIVGGLGLLGYYVASFTDFSGLQYITAQFERLILFTYPMFVMLFGAMFFGARLTVWGVTALAVSYSGIVFVYFEGDISAGDHVLTGALFVLCAAFSFAMYQLMAKKWVVHLGGRMFTCVAMLAASTGPLVHFLIVHMGDGPITVITSLPPRVYWMAGAIAVFSTIIPSFLLNLALERLGPQTLAMLGTLSPIYTVFMAVTLLGEPFGLSDAVGTVLVIGGIALYTTKAR